MSNITLEKPEGITDEEWTAADNEQRQLLVESAAEKAAVAPPKPVPPVTSEPIVPTPNNDLLKEPRSTPVAPDLDALAEGKSPTEVQNAAARGQVFVGEDGKDKDGNDVPADKVAVAGP